MFETGDLALSIFASNEADDRDTILFPLIWSFKNRTNDSHEFGASITLRANGSDLTVNPASVELRRAAGRVVLPSSIRGPAACGRTGYFLAERDLLAEPVVLAARECVVLAVRFPVPPPDPQIPFSIALADVRKAGARIGVPAIHFKEKRRHDPIGAP